MLGLKVGDIPLPQHTHKMDKYKLLLIVCIVSLMISCVTYAYFHVTKRYMEIEVHARTEAYSDGMKVGYMRCLEDTATNS